MVGCLPRVCRKRLEFESRQDARAASEIGCSLVENELLPADLKGLLFWHIDRFDSAERARKAVSLCKRRIRGRRHILAHDD